MIDIIDYLIHRKNVDIYRSYLIFFHSFYQYGLIFNINGNVIMKDFKNSKLLKSPNFSTYPFMFFEFLFHI